MTMIMDRVFAVETKHNIEVVHKTLDPDVEAVEELRALRKLGTVRDKLIELFGGNGLARIEALEAADAHRRAMAAKLIDADEVIEAEVVMPDASPAPTSHKRRAGQVPLDPEEDDI